MRHTLAASTLILSLHRGNTFFLNKHFFIMITEYYIEVPGTTIKESVSGFAYDTLYDMAQQYGIAELCWYALNGTRVVEGVYTDKD